MFIECIPEKCAREIKKSTQAARINKYDDIDKLTIVNYKNYNFNKNRERKVIFCWGELFTPFYS